MYVINYFVDPYPFLIKAILDFIHSNHGIWSYSRGSYSCGDRTVV